MSVAGKIYAGILIDRIHRVIEGLTDGEQGDFRKGRGCERKNVECMWVL